MKAILQIKNLYKSFSSKAVLQELDLEIGHNEVVAVLGPSGTGKSTLLNILAGLEDGDAGRIYWKERMLSQVPLRERHFGIVFQDSCLFPHQSVYDNLSFSLKMRGFSAAQIDKRVAGLVDSFELEGLENQLVENLSGGQKQRVSLGRALASDPELLLLDEPLSALDRRLRKKVSQKLSSHCKEQQISGLYITHDPDEAQVVADKIFRLDEGKLTPVSG